MSNLAEVLIEPELALDEIAAQFDVDLKVSSFEHDCHTAYRLSQHEIDNGYVPAIIRDMKYRLMDFIDTRNREKQDGEVNSVQTQ